MTHHFLEREGRGVDKVLEQEEIDALFAGLSAGEAAAGAAPELELERYNFSRAGQISNEQMRAIATVNDHFARNLMRTVGAWLRTEFTVALVSGERMAYAEFVERVSETTYLCSVRLERLGAAGVIEVELGLAMAIIDLLLGGVGRAEAPRRLTDIEDLIMVSVIQMIVKELNVAWQAAGLEFCFERRETPAQVGRVMPAGEKTLCVCFEVTMPGAQGMLTMCVPAAVLNTTLRTLIAEHDRTRQSSGEVRARVAELVSAAKVGAVLQFPPMKLRAQEVARLCAGYVLRLPLPRHAASELRVGGLEFAQARPVRTGEHRGARLEDRLMELPAGSQPALGA